MQALGLSTEDSKCATNAVFLFTMCSPMLTWLLSLAVAAPPVSLPPSRLVSKVSKPPVIDGELTETRSASDLLKNVSLKSGPVAFKKLHWAMGPSGLYFAAAIDVEQESPKDTVSLTLYFPKSGVMAKGFTYVFDRLGNPLPNSADPLPPLAMSTIKAKSLQHSSLLQFEALVPLSAWPRFSASGPLLVSACAEYLRGDASPAVSNCEQGEMPGGPWQLPDDVRRKLKLTVPADVEGLEARAEGFAGFGTLHFPVWAQGSKPLDRARLEALVVPGEALLSSAVGLTLPPQFELPNGQTGFSVLKGKNPYVTGACEAGNEVRLAVYAVAGATALRVLEWPVSNCALGRAVRFEVGEEGQLTISYSNGTTAHFGWLNGRYERSELGLR